MARQISPDIQETLAGTVTIMLSKIQSDMAQHARGWITWNLELRRLHRRGELFLPSVLPYFADKFILRCYILRSCESFTRTALPRPFGHQTKLQKALNIPVSTDASSTSAQNFRSSPSASPRPEPMDQVNSLQPQSLSQKEQRKRQASRMGT